MSKIPALILLLLVSRVTLAAPSPDLLPYWITENPHSVQTLSHQQWQTFLNKYLVSSEDQQLVHYQQVDDADKTSLTLYTKMLANIDPRKLNRTEQMAYWINLYNALTVITILNHYPVESILDIRSSLFSPGPWKKEIINISGFWLSLNDIEHRILRPIFKDPRVHYALNCASIGCPNLNPQAFTSQNLNELLEQSAYDFINSDKGLFIDDIEVRLSKIYDWYRRDFGDTREGLMIHFNEYLEKKLTINQLGNIEYQYDWTLNEAFE